MNYTLHKPCAQCPFRTDVRPFIHALRARDILVGGADFACHKTVNYDDDDDEDEESVGAVTDKSQHCAGVLIILEREEKPHQMMRIAERLGMYDRRKLDMAAPVYKSIRAAVAAHRKVRA